MSKRYKNEKAYIFFDDVPNLERLEKVLNDNGPIKFVLFKEYPDEATMAHLKSQDITVNILQLLGNDQINLENGELIHHFIKHRLDKLSISSTPSFSIGNDLLERLRNCQTGQEGWIDFEKIGTEVIEFVFKDHFRNYTSNTQSYTHDGIFRRDLVINNNYVASASFWSEMKSEFNSHLIVVDFKNYKDPLDQNEFYLPSKYLNLIVGKFGIVVCRKGLGNAAKTLQRRMFQRDQTLMLCLTDDDLSGMIREKMQGQDSIYRLENQKFQLYEIT